MKFKQSSSQPYEINIDQPDTTEYDFSAEIYARSVQNTNTKVKRIYTENIPLQEIRNTKSSKSSEKTPYAQSEHPKQKKSRKSMLTTFDHYKGFPKSPARQHESGNKR